LYDVAATLQRDHHREFQLPSHLLPGEVWFKGRASDPQGLAKPITKKTDEAEHPKEFNHVGLLVNEPPGSTGLLFT
jgi:hypothetical protein